MSESTMHLSEIIAKNVKAERLRRGISQQKLADLTGLSVRYISRLETEPQNIRVDKVGVLARAMELAPERLLQRAELVPPPPTFATNLGDAIRLLQALHAEVS
jgi:transcriptional regulator with XRE-family HTH domain